MALGLCYVIPRIPRPHRPTLVKRCYHDYIRFATSDGIGRLPLSSPNVIGVASSRGPRRFQEDFYAFSSLSLNPEELRLHVKKHLGIDWDPRRVGDSFSRQVVFVGIYDGHGGSAVSQSLRQELHGFFESVQKSDIPEMYQWIKELGGYFKRFTGGALAPWIHGTEGTEEMDLEARATLAFFEVDRHLSMDPEAKKSGATASVAILHSLDVPATPFFASERVALTVAHCGDTRVILCSSDGGIPYAMTDVHHADARNEAMRLRRMMGHALITDSFGEARWMGALANTRGLGDLGFKRFGVTPEPDVQTKLLKGPEWAYMILVSDGISSSVSDDEIVDLARDAPTPKRAAEKILNYAEELGSDDNATAIVVPLAGWGGIQGPDRTKELRAYRLEQAVGTERHHRM
ncbi:protein serine/threonine phosphatase 2C [Neolentinus lepideus HHB14362 ss-1]|uniref:Protein serine/threonine phosphatase 2C n=1 Tax=Neolentinus lepideus HHB14362 ss-1 TaxID=1314782 RepID=A0A165W504_9AGAM|nr:protein serine/threonine phosphatase 2C [Neolentinus lepideus HHB14362 ss-1]